VDNLDEPFGGLGSWVVAPCGRIDDMVADMLFNDFRDESVEGSPAGRDLLQNRCTIGLRLHGTFNGFQLAADAPDPGQKLLFFRPGV
jgi:hypothetical protein